MSGTIVRIDELAGAVQREIESMNKEVIEKVNKAADKASKFGVKELKATAPVRHDGYKRDYPPGSYAKGFGSTKEGNVLGVTSYVLGNKKFPGLTHLLEFGHIDARTGKRTKAYPHFAQANEHATEQFIREVEGMQL